MFYNDLIVLDFHQQQQQNNDFLQGYILFTIHKKKFWKFLLECK